MISESVFTIRKQFLVQWYYVDMLLNYIYIYVYGLIIILWFVIDKSIILKTRAFNL